MGNRAFAAMVAAFVALAIVAGCASFWASPEAQYGIAQDQCVAEAGTRAQADDCRCRVRIQYPSAPQCAALPDGGWVVPAAAPHTDGAVQ